MNGTDSSIVLVNLCQTTRSHSPEVNIQRTKFCQQGCYVTECRFVYLFPNPSAIWHTAYCTV